MKRILLILCATMLLLVSCESQPTTADGTAPVDTTDTAVETTTAETTGVLTDPNLLFEDNFDGTEPDETKWAYCPEWERQGGMDVWDNDMAYLDGEGHLVLRAEWNETDGKLHSGAVRSDNLFEAGYAYYEASIRLPAAPGIWGAFWMMVGSVGSEENGALDGVEIDIIESINGNHGICNSAIHWDGYGELHQQIANEYADLAVYDGAFHTFGLERTESAYVFYIDDAEVWRVTEEMCAICPEDGYMKLTVEGAEWAGAGSAESIAALPADMVVDYVRVYKEKPTA